MVQSNPFLSIPHLCDVGHTVVANGVGVFPTGQACPENMLEDAKDILVSFQWKSASNLKLEGVTESDPCF